MIDQSCFPVQFLSSFLAIAQARQQEGQQPDNLCGPYWVSILLRSHGFDVTPEAVAQLAGTVLPVGDPASWLPTGATPKQDHSIPLPTTTSASDAGTSAQGLIAAVDQLTQNAYCLLPLQTHWSGDRVNALLQLCQSWQTVPLCNVQTGNLWGSSLAVSDAIAYLNGQPISPPSADWIVGHFLTLAGSVKGAAKQLIVVCDTYLQFGWQGYYLQSAEAVAQALNRNDGYGGGVLLFIPSEHQAAVREQAEAIGLTIEVWDNGSPI
ncbi:hypothetical protein IFO70_07695 [Phormidium tenue FACHB-886]|nr:hypothetical protein [Phormidium tenue FACHB-886]